MLFHLLSMQIHFKASWNINESRERPKSQLRNAAKTLLTNISLILKKCIKLFVLSPRSAFFYRTNSLLCKWNEDKKFFLFILFHFTRATQNLHEMRKNCGFYLPFLWIFFIIRWSVSSWEKCIKKYMSQVINDNAHIEVCGMRKSINVCKKAIAQSCRIFFIFLKSYIDSFKSSFKV